MTSPVSPADGLIARNFATRTVRLTYADCDPAGIIYFASWFPWMERILSEWLYDQGLRSDELLERHGFSNITRHAECEYLHPAELFDEIRVSMVSARIGRTSVQWQFTMVRLSDGADIGRGKLTWVTIDREGQATTVPAVIRETIAGEGTPSYRPG